MSRTVITASIDEAGHFTEAQRKEIIASYPEHERQARVLGQPALGSGRIYPVAEELITCERHDIPRHWARIGAMDFGYSTAFAAVELAWDRDNDCIYVNRTYKVSQQTPVLHAAALRPWGKTLPWAWPRDGRQETLAGAGVPLMRQYQEQGLEMLLEPASFPDKGASVEAGVMEILDRMQSGRFKVWKHHHEWLSEFRLYHRKDGKIHKEHDHLLDATRYGIMCLRFARTETEYDAFTRPIQYPKRAVV